LEAAWGITPAVTGYVDAKHEFIRAARTLRADYNIAPKETVVLVVKPSTPALAAALEADREGVMAMTKARSLDLAPDYAPQGAMPSALTPLGTLFMSIEGLVDTDAEAKKLAGQLEKSRRGWRRWRASSRTRRLSARPRPRWWRCRNATATTSWKRKTSWSA
jgi:valyl-tRNA synthetase